MISDKIIYTLLKKVILAVLMLSIDLIVKFYIMLIFYEII